MRLLLLTAVLLSWNLFAQGPTLEQTLRHLAHHPGIKIPHCADSVDTIGDYLAMSLVWGKDGARVRQKCDKDRCELQVLTKQEEGNKSTYLAFLTLFFEVSRNKQSQWVWRRVRCVSVG